MLLNIEYDDNIYTIASLYCHNDQGELLRFLSKCTEWVNSNRIDGSYLVLGSDMNCVHWPSDRSTNKIDSISKALRDLKFLLM